MEPVWVVEESLIAMGGEDEVFVLNSFHDFFFSLFFKHLLLTGDVDNQKSHNAEKHLTDIFKGLYHLIFNL